MNSEKQPFTYLNTAGAGLVSPESIAAAEDFQNKSLVNPPKYFFQFMDEGLPDLRQKMAALLHAKPSQIAFTPNFSYSLLAVIDSIRSSVKNVLLYKDDYPSLTLPFELGGFQIHYVENEGEFAIPVSKIKEIALKEKVEVIAISHVQFLTGFAIDLNELGTFCRGNNISLIVDATQSMGAFDFNFETLPVDVLISSSYKWLNGGFGSAVMCIKDSFMDKYPPKSAGFGSMNHDANGWTYNPSVLSYEPGHLNVAGLLQLQKALEQRLKTGVSAVEKHDRSLIKRLATGLSGTSFKVAGGYDAAQLATILCFEAEESVGKYLSEKNIAVTWRKGKIRVGPHFYNTNEDIDRLIGALKEWESGHKIATYKKPVKA